MKVETLTLIKEALEKELQLILTSLKRETEEVDADGDETDEIQAGQIASMHNMLAEKNRLKVGQIEAALKNIEKGEYGNCEECGDEIAEKRLIFNPHFTTCISCAEAKEMHQKRR